MKLARRRLAQILLGSAAAGMCSWRDTVVARAVATIDPSLYPTLIRLASLYSDDAACLRVASTLDPSAVLALTGSGLARAERNAARTFAGKQNAGPHDLHILLADDFRRERTVQAAGFRLAETEAAIMLIRRTTIFL